MNQTKKRLQIIKLAISIGDIETIQLQMLKLSALKTDEKIQEIIKGLQAENYAQTQALITDYIETPIEEILQRTSQDRTTSAEEDEAIIEEFDLFRIKPKSEDDEIEEILDMEGFNGKNLSKEEEKTEVDFDTLLNLKSEEVLANNIEIKQTLSPKDDFFDQIEENEKYNYTEVIEKDNFFEDIPSPDEKKQIIEDDLFKELLQTNMENKTTTDPSTPLYNETVQDEILVLNDKKEKQHPVSEKKESTPEKKISTSQSIRKNTVIKDNHVASHYEAIPYIDQKLKNMQTQYPPLEESEENFSSVNAWLMKISNEGYTEQEVEEMISHIQTLSKKGEKAEAAQLLLISAATHSKYAQFMLARSLFKGDLLEKNLPEAFTLINRLAMDDEYAEAICDLGQLYENGIGIDKDKKRAEVLYKEAMDQGIKRAESHYERLHKANKGLLGRLFKK